MFPHTFPAAGTSGSGLNLALIHSVGVTRHPVVPVTLAAIEGVEVDLLAHALGETGAGILPEHPVSSRIDLGGMRRHRAQPERVILERALQVVLIEIGRGIDDRLLAVMAFDLLDEDAHLLQYLLTCGTLLALRECIPLHIQYRGQGALLLRDVADEPVSLLGGRPAPIEKVIGAVLQARSRCSFPVLVEHRIEMIPAVGGFDVDEVGAVLAQLLPIDVALPARDVDAMNGKVLGRVPAEVDWLGVAETLAVNLLLAARR